MLNKNKGTLERNDELLKSMDTTYYSREEVVTLDLSN